MLWQLFTLASLSTVAFAITKDDCPPGLFRDKYLVVHGDKCYRFDLHTRKTFDDAESYCKQDGGNLALVKSDEINKFIKKSIYSFTNYQNNDHFWIGLRHNNHQFIWWDGSYMSYSKIPSSDKGGKNKCVAIKGEFGYWITDRCVDDDEDELKTNRFICEYQVSQTTTPATTTTTTTATTSTATATTSTTAIPTMTKAGRTHASLPGDKERCPSSIDDEEKKFKVSDNICYYFNSKMKLSYWDSERYCQKFGGILAVANSAHINMFIEWLLKENTPGVDYYSEPSWIGLRFDSAKDGYYWSDGTPQVYTNYEETGRIRECVAMFPWDGLWKEKGCQWNDGDSEKHTFVCQFQVPGQSTTTITTRTPATQQPDITTTRRPRK